MNRREEALDIVERYSYYHAGTAVTVGTLGGQFGADTFALTALTISMIEEICNIYDITDRGAKNVHIARAVARLTYKGTFAAKTILNWLPFGSLVNGTVSFFLTRNAGKKCISEIEQEQMTLSRQIGNGLIDIGKSIALDASYDLIDEYVEPVSEEIINRTKEVLGNDLGEDLGIDKLIAALDQLPIDTTDRINETIGATLKASVQTCLNNQGNIKSADFIKQAFIGALFSMLDGKVKLTEEEFQFRLLFDESHRKAFDDFLTDAAAKYDRIALERGTWEAVKFVYSSISEECKTRFGMTSESIVKSVFDNPYDRSIEEVYKTYLPLISSSDNEDSAFAKGVMLYQTLCLVNRQYNVSKISSDGKDNGLLYYIAGRMRECTQVISSKTTDFISFKLSEFVSEYRDSIELHLHLPVIGMNDELRKLESIRVFRAIDSFWLPIMRNCNSMQALYSDGIAYYIMRFQANSLFFGRSLDLVKDDTIIYTTAELMKNNLSVLKNNDVNTVAYYISEKISSCLGGL